MEYVSSSQQVTNCIVVLVVESVILYIPSLGTATYMQYDKKKQGTKTKGVDQVVCHCWHDRENITSQVVTFTLTLKKSILVLYMTIKNNNDRYNYGAK